MHCENCKTKPEGSVLESQSNNSDWNDWKRYDHYKNGAVKMTEFDIVFFCYDCFPQVKDVYVEDLSLYNEGADRY